MKKQRLDELVVQLKKAPTRSQAVSMIKLGEVQVNGQAIHKPGYFVSSTDRIVVADRERYVSRAGLKLASVAQVLEVHFTDKIVLDVGSSTGGFTDYALQRGAKKVLAVDVGTEQLHPSLRGSPKIDLHEKTDIRDFIPAQTPDIVVIDVSFISLRAILPHIATITRPQTQIVAMVKPQFEAQRQQVQKGVIKNDAVRRKIMSDFEVWAKQYFVVTAKADSEVAGAKGNRERFYLLSPLAKKLSKH